MAFKLFGYEFIRSSKEEKEQQPISFAEPLNDDGALNVGTAALGGSYSMILDLENSAKTEAELIARYRSMALTPEIQQAVDEVVNEAISVSSHEKTVEVVLDDIKISDKVKKRIREEFEIILKLLNFSNDGYDIFSKFYIDGRLNYHAIIDEKKPGDGLKELRYLDPRKIRLIREIEDVPIDKQTYQLYGKRIKNEYYMYSDSGFSESTTGITSINQNISGIKIAKDSIVRITSGIVNETNTVVLSHLHKAIKPLNQLKMLEDANVVYTLTRSPERRVFYIDVGNLPKAKAEQYLYDMMTRHKNKVVYDSTTGEIKDSRKMLSMTEDYWFPRKDGNRITEVDTLPSSGSLSDNESLQYFQTKLFKALNIPLTRLQSETMFNMGRTSEITREELKFSKFIQRLRTKFSVLFDKCLEKQLILKGIISPEEWQEIQDSIRYDFMKDNFFQELKETEILREKISTLRDIEEHVGKYFSRGWVRKNVIFMSDDDIKTMDAEIEKERKSGVYGDDEPPPTSTNEPEQPDPAEEPEQQELKS